jgi:hypothetical protein
MIEDLIKRLDHPTPWVVRGGPGAILAWTRTLREALSHAFELSRNGEAPTSIREPDDRTVIPAEQIWELWEHLGMVDKRPRRIADRYVAKGVAVVVAGAIGFGTVMADDLPHNIEIGGNVTLYSDQPAVAISSSVASTMSTTWFQP